MDTFLNVAAVVLLVGACLAGCAMLLFGLPGTFFIVGACLAYAWATGFAALTWGTLAWLLALAVAGEGLELLAASGAAGGRERPSRRVMAGALVGGIAGAILGAPILLGAGAFPGALAGAFFGAAVAVVSEGGTMNAALSTGMAALRGRLLGFVLKAAVAAAMLIVVAAALL